MPTGLALITDALKTLGAVSSGEAPTSGEADDALIAFNRMIDAWAAEGLTAYTITATTKTLATSTATYTIGSGGSINIVRPVSIHAAGIVLDSTATIKTEVPIEVLTLQRWEEVRQKTVPSSPAWGIYYDAAWAAGLGTINVVGVPTSNTTQLILYCPTALTSVTLTGTTYTWPPGYEEALQYNLALRLAASFPSAPSRMPMIVQIARESLARIKRVNLRPSELRCDEAALQGSGRAHWNILSDTTNYP